MELTQQKLKELLHYNERTGIFTWENPRARRLKVGDLAGNLDKAGYRSISITVDGRKKLYYSHRLAWLYEYGVWPKGQIDHINHNRSDNRLCNLREADNTTNHKNRTINKNNTSGITGVYWNKNHKKWRAKIIVSGKNIHLGLFTDKNEAICARLHANRLYKFHANHGKSTSL